jgi:hypothetical protein
VIVVKAHDRKIDWTSWPRTYFARRCSGLAKTLAINTLAQAVHGSFSRIQFTPDLLADVVGTMIYNIKQNEFSIKKDQFLPISFWQMRSTERQSAVGFIRSHAGKTSDYWRYYF